MADDTAADLNQEDALTERGITTAADLLAFLSERPQSRAVIVGSYHTTDTELFSPAVTDSGEVVAWINPNGTAAALLRSVADNRPTAEALSVGLQFLPKESAWILPAHPGAFRQPAKEF